MTNKKNIARTKKLSKLIDILINGDSFEKEKAMEQILSNPTAEAVGAVIRLLYPGETSVRMFAVDILKKIGHLNIMAIIELLDDENEDIAIYACEILSDVKQKEAVPYLIKKLKEDRVNVRNTACIALGDIGDERAVDALIDVLKDDEWVEFSAVQSLGKIGSEKAIAPLLDIFEHSESVVSLIACEVLICLGDEQVLERVIKVLKKWEKKKRGDYIKIILEEENESTFHIMKERMGKELFEHLLSIIKNEDKKSLKILKSIAEFKNMTACNVILDTFRHVSPDDDDYYEMLKIFSDLADVWAGHVEQILRREEEECILPFIKACGLSIVKIEERLLLKKFLTSSVEIKREIVKNIPVIVDGNGFSIIREAMEDSDGHIKGDAVAVIGSMGAKEFMDKVTEIAKQGFFDMRLKALRTLYKLDHENILRIMEEFVNEGTVDDKKLYLSVAPFLNVDDNYDYIKKLLFDDDAAVKKATINVLGRFLDNNRYMELFKRLLNSGSVPHEALKIIKDRKLTYFTDILLRIFSDTNNDLWTRYYALMALGSFGDHALLDIFLKGLADDNSLIKIGSLKALSNLNDRDVLQFVRPFIDSLDEDVRSTAESVVEKLEGM